MFSALFVCFSHSLCGKVLPYVVYFIITMPSPTIGNHGRAPPPPSDISTSYTVGTDTVAYVGDGREMHVTFVVCHWFSSAGVDVGNCLGLEKKTMMTLCANPRSF